MVGILIIGNPRSGKTLLATILVFMFHEKTYSNYKIHFDNFESDEIILSKLFKTEYSNCVFVLDEAYNYLESRISKSNLNRYMSYFLFQSGKRDVSVILTAQLLSTIDLRFRELMDYVILAEKLNNKFRFTIYSTRNKKSKIVILNFQKAKQFFNHYDTKQIILPDSEKIMKRLLPESEKIVEAKKIAEDIKIELNNQLKITKNMVKIYFIENNISDVFFDYTYPLVIRNEKKAKKKKE